MYRTRDGGDSWERTENGLSSGGRLRVYRSLTCGDSWEPLGRGLPEEHAYALVLRGAMAVDGLDPAGVYFGTTAGGLYASRDGGQTWQALPVTLPRVLCVAAFVV